jgi:hypothetical protein
MMHDALRVILTLFAYGACHAFTSPVTDVRSAAASRRPGDLKWTGNSPLSLTGDSEGLDELSEERKANLFQFMLRDLQVEGVPLLGVDASQVDTFQAAMWTTLAELCDQPSADKACMIFEDIPVPALRSFVDDFMILKTQERLISNLPELARFSLSLVGKGVGPAILIDAEDVEEAAISTNQVEIEESLLGASMKAFFSRIGEKTDVYPYVKEGSGLSFKTCRRNDICHILSSFWNGVCEMQATDEAALGTAVIMFPGVESHGQFSVVSEILSRSLCLLRGDDVFEPVYFHPKYDRSKIHPVAKPAHGHIPPLEWMRSILRATGNQDEAEHLSNEDLALSNYQRRAPVGAVAIKRVSLIDLDNDPVVPLQLETNETVPASGISPYASNAIFLASEGEMKLNEALKKEQSILQ